MIGKAASIAHGAEAMDYALEKENAEVIDKHYVVGDTSKEIKQEFKITQDLNQRAKNKDISIVLSPEPADGKTLTNKDYRAIADDYLKKMNLQDHQSLVVKHTDKAHTHLHIYVNRIDNNGKAYNDSYISKKTQNIADEIAQERGLTRASLVKEFNKEMTKDLRQQIFDKHKAVLEHRPKDFKSYSELMQSSGVKVVPTINKAKQLQGYRLEFNGHSFKASEVHRSMTLSKMGVNTKLTKAIKPKIGSKIGSKALSKGLGVAANLNPALKIGVSVVKTINKGISR